MTVAKSYLGKLATHYERRRDGMNEPILAEIRQRAVTPEEDGSGHVVTNLVGLTYDDVRPLDFIAYSGRAWRILYTEPRSAGAPGEPTLTAFYMVEGQPDTFVVPRQFDPRDFSSADFA